MDFILENIYWLISILLVVVGVLILLIIKLKKPNNKIIVDEEYLNKVVSALGGFKNIKTTEIEHKRVRVFLNNNKLIVTSIFKELEIPVFLKGNEAKLLLKEEPLMVKKYLDNKGD